MSLIRIFRTLSTNRSDWLVISTALMSPLPVPLVVPATCSVRIPSVLLPHGRSASMCGVADRETEAWGWKEGTCRVSQGAGHGCERGHSLSPPLRVPPSPWLSAGGSLVLGCCRPGPALPTGLTLLLAFAHRGLRATAKITYQAVLLENLVHRSSSSSSSPLSWGAGRAMAISS